MESNRQTILVVDDEGINIGLLTEAFKEEYRVLAAKNGEMALKVAGSDKVDLILLDIIMPGIDGYEVCKRLKEDLNTKNIPIIFTTGVNEIEGCVKAFQAGAVDFIQKPLNPVVVKARVVLHLKLQKTMQELKDALDEVKTLSGLLPICSYCKKIRDDKGYWNQIEEYISHNSDAEFSHSICRDCADIHYPDMNLYDDKDTQK